MDITLFTRTYEVEDRSWLGSEEGTDSTQSITLDVSKFTAATHYPKGYIRSGTVLGRLTATGLYAPYAGNTAEVQTITITGAPTGGTFTLGFRTDTTAAINWNATAAQVQSALEATPLIDVGDVTVTGGPGPATPWTVTFGGKLTGDQPQMTATSSLTGGTTPAVAVATTVQGGSAIADGSQIAAGFLFNTIQVVRYGAATNAARVGAPLMWNGVIRKNRLPANSGLDATAEQQLGAKFLIWTR